MSWCRWCRGWTIWIDYFWRALWRHRKRGNVAILPLGIIKSKRMADCARAVNLGPPYNIRWMKWAVLLVVSLPSPAIAVCPVPNPNEVAPPFVADCPLPAAALNRLAPSASPTFTGNTTVLGSVSAAQILAPVPTAVYVGPSGVDAGSCLSAAPCATIHYAITQAQNGRLANGQNILVLLLAGSYTESVNLRGASSSGTVAATDNIGLINTDNNMVLIQGAGSGATVWNGGSVECGTLIVEDGAVAGIAGLTIEGTGNVCQSTLFSQIGTSVIHVYGPDVVLGSAAVEQIHVENAGQVHIWGGASLTGTAQRFVGGSGNAFFVNSGFPSGTLTTVGTPAYSQEFVFVQTGAVAQFAGGTTFAGTGATGKRFTVLRNASILVPSNSMTFLPGSSPGEQAQGGIYAGPAGDYHVAARPGGAITIMGVWPTTCVGHPSGTLWNNAGVINVCP